MISLSALTGLRTKCEQDMLAEANVYEPIEDQADLLEETRDQRTASLDDLKACEQGGKREGRTKKQWKERVLALKKANIEESELKGRYVSVVETTGRLFTAKSKQIKDSIVSQYRDGSLWINEINRIRNKIPKFRDGKPVDQFKEAEAKVLEIAKNDEVLKDTMQEMGVVLDNTSYKPNEEHLRQQKEAKNEYRQMMYAFNAKEKERQQVKQVEEASKILQNAKPETFNQQEVWDLIQDVPPAMRVNVTNEYNNIVKTQEEMKNAETNRLNKYRKLLEEIQKDNAKYQGKDKSIIFKQATEVFKRDFEKYEKAGAFQFFDAEGIRNEIATALAERDNEYEHRTKQVKQGGDKPYVTKEKLAEELTKINPDYVKYSDVLATAVTEALQLAKENNLSVADTKELLAKKVNKAIKGKNKIIVKEANNKLTTTKTTNTNTKQKDNIIDGEVVEGAKKGVVEYQDNPLRAVTTEERQEAKFERLLEYMQDNNVTSNMIKNKKFKAELEDLLESDPTRRDRLKKAEKEIAGRKDGKTLVQVADLSRLKTYTCAQGFCMFKGYNKQKKKYVFDVTSRYRPINTAKHMKQLKKIKTYESKTMFMLSATEVPKKISWDVKKKVVYQCSNGSTAEYQGMGSAGRFLFKLTTPDGRLKKVSFTVDDFIAGKVILHTDKAEENIKEVEQYIEDDLTLPKPLDGDAFRLTNHNYDTQKAYLTSHGTMLLLAKEYDKDKHVVYMFKSPYNDFEDNVSAEQIKKKYAYMYPELGEYINFDGHFGLVQGIDYITGIIQIADITEDKVYKLNYELYKKKPIGKLTEAQRTRFSKLLAVNPDFEERINIYLNEVYQIVKEE